MKNYFNTLCKYSEKIDSNFNRQEAITRRKLFEQLQANRNEIVLEPEQVKILAQDKELFEVLELGLL